MVIAISGAMHPVSCSESHSSNAARTAANPKEEIMFKLSRDDLHRKTDAQLADLFNRAAREIGTVPRLTLAFRQASAALRLVCDELARRGISIR